MTKVHVGVTLPQFTGDASRFLDGVRRAEDAGLESVWLFDHLWPLSGKKERPILEAWTALGAIAARTERVTIGTMVTRSSLRHPALLGKMAATVNEIAAGRLVIGIGSGDDLNRAENDSFGIPFLERDRRVPQLASTVEVVRRFLTQPEVDQSDEFVSIDGLPASPQRDPAPAIWVGGRTDEVLEIAARKADGWNAWGSTPDQFARDAATVAELAAGRAVELSWAGQVILGATEEDARAQLGSRNADDYLVGSPATVAARLRAYVDAGARHLIVAFPVAREPGSYERLASDVVPLLLL